MYVGPNITNLFFNPSTVDNTVIENLPQSELLHCMSIKPTVDKVNSQSNKSILAEHLDLMATQQKYCSMGDNVASAILDLITMFWDATPIPQDWIDGSLVSLFKGKGSKSVCDSYQGITLLEVVGKVLARLLLNRLMNNVCPLVIPESQSGFRSGKGTMDMIFSVRQLQENCIEQ